MLRTLINITISNIFFTYSTIVFLLNVLSNRKRLWAGIAILWESKSSTVACSVRSPSANLKA